ncbi:MAG: (4Fe-4S)-binding protein [Christensenellaceae bacterium]|nr:(4Fe-4S)-binding protein [Christensenellaceae bacterium]
MTIENTCTLSPEDIRRVKGMGFLHARGTNCFNARIITRNGYLNNKEMQAVTDAARRYGNGEIAMTTRLTLEIQGVPYENVEALQQDMAKEGLIVGGTGNKVRPVVCCKGSTCQYGLINTRELALKIHDLFFLGYNTVALPHKFKIAVGGCPNNCVKPELNDVGIVGQRLAKVDNTLCRGCKVCVVEKNCPIHSATCVQSTLSLGEECNHCGRCIGRCPFGVVTEVSSGCRVYLGGRWGKKTAVGKPMDKIFTQEEEVLQVVEKAILLFREQGIKGERFADTIARLGFSQVQSQLMADDLLERKEAILKEA